MKRFRLHQYSGFTLIELAVVLVIIGLIVGGITMGNSMLRSANLRSTIGDIDKYRQATLNFETKYGSLPGDMADAESYWGSDTGCPATAYNTVKKTATCNGNGDGNIVGAEMYRAWQEMADAGMIPGSYTGVAGPDGPNEHFPGINCPEASFSHGGFEILTLGIQVGDPTLFDGDYGVSIGVGRERNPFGVDSPLFTGSEALAIDKKIDDGLPGTGKLRPFKNSLTPGCTTSDDPTVSKYVVGTDDIICSLKVIVGHE